MRDSGSLSRFLDAQASIYADVQAELRQGFKRGHWMWFIFPQLRGLGRSETAQFYAIRSREEAASYLAHPTLGERLRECTELVLAIPGKDVHAIFGSPDDLKFRSSMTLFGVIAPGESVFRRALQKYFGGQPDQATLALLGALDEPG